MASIPVVDDDVDLATIVEDHLLSQKHSVKVVHAGLEASWPIESNNYDLAVLDWDLPDVKGIEILKKLRASGSRIPVIRLTGRASSNEKELGLLGSPPYMSPEQVLGNAPDERSDVYAFSCVETTTGYPAFFGKTAVEILVKHVQTPPMTFKEVRPERTYPKELVYVVDRALAKKPEERYQTTNELRMDLKRIMLSLRDSSM